MLRMIADDTPPSSPENAAATTIDSKISAFSEPVHCEALPDNERNRDGSEGVDEKSTDFDGNKFHFPLENNAVLILLKIPSSKQ